MRFYYPLKPTRITLNSPLFTMCKNNKNFIAQRKKDGWRVQIHKEGNNITIYTRHKKLLKPMIGDVDWISLSKKLATSIQADSCILDGEFLHRRTASWREHFCLWDMFEHNGKTLNMKYLERKELLDKIISPSKNLSVLTNHMEFNDLWNSLDLSADEGIVIKDLNEQLYVNFNKTIKSPRQFKVLLADPANCQ